MLLGALVLEMVIGELPARIHPVCWIGSLVGALRRRLPRRPAGPASRGGLLLVIVVVSLAIAVGWAVLEGLEPWPGLRFCAGVFLLTATFSFRMLIAEGHAMARLIRSPDLEEARARLGHLCSRDASTLERGDLVACTVESLAENTSDSIVAPMFWFLIFGLPGALAFRAINTLDAMVGYRGEYEYLGKASAKLDDVAGFVPSRITARIFLWVGTVMGFSVRQGAVILGRDADKTLSPNAGRPMAAVSGLLGVELTKVGEYTLGDPTRPRSTARIEECCRLVAGATWVAASATIAALGLMAWWMGGE